KSAKELFAKNAGINTLAAARVALFGTRYVVCGGSDRHRSATGLQPSRCKPMAAQPACQNTGL
ncbi:hypothetical protein, partial [Hydrogenophaga sp.]|uniref:hypothetical protein n=1 Tax=Hydrogenophaga sp. TaxID=1904254 RepID=UPI003F6D8866